MWREVAGSWSATSFGLKEGIMDMDLTSSPTMAVEPWKVELEQWLREEQCDSYGVAAFWMTIKPARDLIDAHMPKRLFKYVNIDEKGFFIRMLNEGIVGLKSAIRFNDPFDTLQKLDTGLIDQLYSQYDIKDFLGPRYAYVHGLASPKELWPYYTEESRRMEMDAIEAERWTDEKFEYYLQHPEEFIKKSAVTSKNLMMTVQRLIQSSMYVSCFSESVTNMLMWSHYAVNHECFALEYDFDDADNAEWKKYLFPVIYSEKKFDATFGVYEFMDDQNFSDMEFVHNYLVCLKSALFKNPDWSYEKEWRLVRRELANRDIHSTMPVKAKAIYYGARINKDDLRHLHRMASDLGLEEYQMEIDVESDGYDMKVVPFEMGVAVR